MERKFTRENIDFNKLHGEIRENMARQAELRKQGVRAVVSYFRGEKLAWETRGTTFWYPKVPEDMRQAYELGYLTSRLTVLLSILNYAKGKNHFEKLDKSFWKYNVGYYDLTKDLQVLHEMVIGKEWEQFVKVEAVSA